MKKKIHSISTISSNYKQKGLFLLIGILLLVNCEKNPIALDEKLIARTDKTIYGINELLTIWITNKTSSTAFFSHCGNQIVFGIEQKKTEKTWIELGGWGMPCPALFEVGNIELKGDCSYSETIGLHVPCGIYRLKFPFDWQKESLWAEWLFSNEFTVQ